MNWTATQEHPTREIDPRERGLAECVQRSLRNARHQELRSVEVGVHEGLVTLKGNVETYYLKQLAQATAMQTAGVELVQNQIRVR
jgi:osmotically-inducible protein OsmY